MHLTEWHTCITIALDKKFCLKHKKLKAELLQEGIIFLIHLFVRDVVVMKKLEIQKTKSTFIICTSFKSWILVSSISNFFSNKTSLVNKWTSFSSSNVAKSDILYERFLVKDLKILSFKVIYKCLKLVKSFQKIYLWRIFDQKTNLY